MQKAAQRKAMAKAVAKCVAAGSMPGQQDTTDKSKRTRQQTTPIKFSTPGSKTPDPKQLKKEPTATPKKLFEGA